MLVAYYIWKLYPSGRYEPYTLVTSVPVDLLCIDLLNCCTAVHVPIALDLQVYRTGRSIGLLYMYRQYLTAIPVLLDQVRYDCMHRLCL